MVRINTDFFCKRNYLVAKSIPNVTFNRLFLKSDIFMSTDIDLIYWQMGRIITDDLQCF